MKIVKKNIKKYIYSIINIFKPVYVIKKIHKAPNKAIIVDEAYLNINNQEAEYLKYQKLFKINGSDIKINKNVEIHFFKNVIVDLDNGVALTQKREIIIESLKYPNFVPGTFLRKINDPKKIDGNIVVVNPALNSQYFHIWFDGLVKLYYLSQLKDIKFKILLLNDSNSIYKNVVLRCNHLFDVEIIKNNQFVQAENYYVVKNVFWGKHAPHFSKRINKFFVDIFPESKENSSIKKFFIKRKVAGRGIINEKEVEDHFVNAGFTLISLEDLSLVEQFRLFNNAEIVAGLHGAGFTNLIFASSKLKVIELQNFAVVPTYYFICKQLGLDYYPVFYKDFNLNQIVDPHEDSRSFYEQKLYSVSYDLKDIDVVLNALKN